MTGDLGTLQKNRDVTLLENRKVGTGRGITLFTASRGAGT